MAKRSANSGSAARGNPPSEVTIRMYNVGFGDCFLLTFHYARDERHMLIDYGSTAGPVHGPEDCMQQVAQDIKKVSKGKLHIVVATHRHRDHISGFVTNGAGTGKVIRSLNPDYVIQPWTEDPGAKPSAMTATSSSYTGGKADDKTITSHFLGSLEDMHRIAASAEQFAKTDAMSGGRDTINQLAFLGEDNLKNLSAVNNLMDMGKRARAFYVSAGMKLNGLLPGVKISVLGPPTLKQSDSIRKERSKDPSEFWQFRSFWSSQRLAATTMRPEKGEILFANVAPVPDSEHDPNVRWFIEKSKRIRADQMLDLVRDLDGVMNNTSVILLFEIGGRKMLFPGDAQIENWAYALSKPETRALLKNVNLYKVGHHGSLNATPRSLWSLFSHKGNAQTHDRLETLCSTRPGKHGNADQGTEVPRAILVAELEKNSDFVSTDRYKNTISQDITIRTAK